MSFLKKLGQIIATGIEIITGIGPILSAAIPGSSGVIGKVANDLQSIAQIVIQAEAMGAALGLSGADKLRAATGPVVQILMQSELIAGHPVTDAAALTTAAQNIINGVVAALNAINANAIKTQPIAI